MQALSTEFPSDSEHAWGIDPISSELRDGARENDFLAHHLAETQSLLRLTLIFCSFFYLAFALTDIAVLGYGRDALILFLGRLTVALTAGACFFLTAHHPRSIAMTRLGATAVEVVGMSVFMLIVVHRPGEMAWHAMSMAIMLVVVYIFIPNRLVYSLAVALGATGAFIALAFAMGTLAPSDMLTMSMLLVLTNMFGFVAARRYHRLWRMEFRAQSILRSLSMNDPLTGCFNRRYLQENLLENEILRARRYGLSLSVVMCDLDHFKAINDTYGHHGGDAVLRTFAELLRKMTRRHIDCVVRYGGEEFLLILPETNLHDAVLLAERLRGAFAAAATAHDGNELIRATASFGVATVDFALASEAITLEGLIASADSMLYGAKRGGRNQVRSLQLP